MTFNQLVRSSADALIWPVDPATLSALAGITPECLRDSVVSLSYPRHYELHPDANRKAGDDIAGRLESYGYTVEFQGPHRNVVAQRRSDRPGPVTVVGAHYDSATDTVGADDNASAVAALLACAEAVAAAGIDRPMLFVSFNREETNVDRSGGLLGSIDFVRERVVRGGLKVADAHIFEMVGYCDRTEGSQHAPPGVPVNLPKTGDWLGLLGNAGAASLLGRSLSAARTYAPGLTALGIALPRWAESAFRVLLRSDHAPFWHVGVPTLLWTDTSEFRNPHYHKPSDTPDTLDYDFLASVARAAAACLLAGPVAG